MSFSLDIAFLGKQNFAKKQVYLFYNNFNENMDESLQPLMP